MTAHGQAQAHDTDAVSDRQRGIAPGSMPVGLPWSPEAGTPGSALADSRGDLWPCPRRLRDCEHGLKLPSRTHSRWAFGERCRVFGECDELGVAAHGGPGGGDTELNTISRRHLCVDPGGAIVLPPARHMGGIR